MKLSVFTVKKVESKWQAFMKRHENASPRILSGCWILTTLLLNVGATPEQLQCNNDTHVQAW